MTPVRRTAQGPGRPGAGHPRAPPGNGPMTTQRKEGLMTTTTPTRRAEEARDVEDPPSELSELRKITITMPAWMLADLRRRARGRGITVTELIRRGVSLERMLFEDPDTEVLLRDTETGKETAIRLV
jgi:hypothetical protein